MSSSPLCLPKLHFMMTFSHGLYKSGGLGVRVMTRLKPFSGGKFRCSWRRRKPAVNLHFVSLKIDLSLWYKVVVEHIALAYLATVLNWQLLFLHAQLFLQSRFWSRALTDQGSSLFAAMTLVIVKRYDEFVEWSMESLKQPRIAIEETIQPYKCNFATSLHMSETKGGYNCTACGASFSSHEGLVNHNREAHGAAEGAQIRQSEEIQKQRREE